MVSCDMYMNRLAPKEFYPYSVMVAEDEHVLLIDKKKKLYLDPTSDQYDKPWIGFISTPMYFKTPLKLKPTEIEDVAKEARSILTKTSKLPSISHRLRADSFDESPKRQHVYAVELWYDRRSRNWICYAVDRNGNEVSDYRDEQLSADYVGNRDDGNYALKSKLTALGLDPAENARRMRDIKQKRGY